MEPGGPGRERRQPLQAGATAPPPAGRFPLRRVHYRADRLPALATGLETRVIRPTDGWCSDPGHDDYNRLITLPYDGDVDRLWLEDTPVRRRGRGRYNDDPPIAGLGSVRTRVRNQRLTADGSTGSATVVAMGQQLGYAGVRRPVQAREETT
jgi:hypothetical protein